MKTTIEVSDTLFTSVKDFAQRRQTTLRALVEEGLRRVMADGDSSAKPVFKLADASVKGKQMLMSDPRRWQEMEQDHVIGRVARPRR